MEEEFLNTEREVDPEDHHARLHLLMMRQRRGQEITEESLLALLPFPGVRRQVLDILQLRDDPLSRFLAQVETQVQAARDLYDLDPYEWLRPHDAPLPGSDEILRRLSEHLATHPHHRDAIREMHEPLVLLSPVFFPQYSSTEKVFQAVMSAKRSLLRGEDPSDLLSYLSKILRDASCEGWNIFIIEAKRRLSSDSSPWLGFTELRQLEEWTRRSREDGIMLPTRNQYELLNTAEFLRDGSEGVDPSLTLSTLLASSFASDSNARFEFFSTHSISAFGLVTYSPMSRNTDFRALSFRPTILVGSVSGGPFGGIY